MGAKIPSPPRWIRFSSFGVFHDIIYGVGEKVERVCGHCNCVPQPVFFPEVISIHKD